MKIDNLQKQNPVGQLTWKILDSEMFPELKTIEPADEQPIHDGF